MGLSHLSNTGEFILLLVMFYFFSIGKLIAPGCAKLTLLMMLGFEKAKNKIGGLLSFWHTLLKTHYNRCIG
jgi:hypothetical protein